MLNGYIIDIPQHWLCNFVTLYLEACRQSKYSLEYFFSAQSFSLTLGGGAKSNISSSSIIFA